ncbi:hypothetical protein OSB04_029389 [Centaurea solstitialis]|uniref:Reverse transcriptase Ty1/copia-type domain-containing protein n=1 Tax=Centaurea solstitialis TaxID=347529 RepID=A0AA38SQ22_9ASTR|nr:hypothetical protein OSB04_029389 [Centaurea solstitialis]
MKLTKLEPRTKKCRFIGYPYNFFRYIFYKPSENKVFVARRVFLERELISKRDSGNSIDVEEIQETANDEPIVGTSPQPEVELPIEETNISPPLFGELVDNRKTFGCKWIFKNRTDMDGNVYTFKARRLQNVTLKLKGLRGGPTMPKARESSYSNTSTIFEHLIVFSGRPKGQEPVAVSAVLPEALGPAIAQPRQRRAHYDEIFAPVTKIKPIRILLDMAAFHDYEIWQMDVKTIFLIGKLDRNCIWHNLKMSWIPYASTIRSIMYDMTCTRPDVPFALSMASRKDEVRVTASEAAKEVAWLKNFIGDLGVVPSISEPIEIFCDNEGAVSLTKKPKDYGKSKDIEKKYHFVRHKVEEKQWW